MADRRGAARRASSGAARAASAPGRVAAPSARAARPDRLEELVHQKTRLGILSALAAGGRLSFGELKGHLELSDGNLSVHARRLEEAGYLRCSKSFAGRTPLTEYELTAAGRRALERYLDHMEAILAAARAARRD